MMELGVLVILIIILGIGLFIIISKVASTPEPEEEPDSVEEDVFETSAEDNLNEKKQIDESEKDDALEEDNQTSSDSSSNLVRYMGSFKTHVMQWIKQSGTAVQAGGARMMRYIKGVFLFCHKKISALFHSTSEHASSDSNTEEERDFENNEESEAADTSFLEEPTQQKRSFSTFESDFEESEPSIEDFSQKDIHDQEKHATETVHPDTSHMKSNSHNTSSEEKVDTFVQSMLENQEDETPSSYSPSSHNRTQQFKEPRKKEEKNTQYSSSTKPSDSSSQTVESSHLQDSKHKESSAKDLEDDHLKKLEQKYLTMIVNDPKNVDSYRRLGNLYLAMENYTDARETFRHILRLKKDDQRAQDKLQEIERILKRNNNV